SIFDIVYGGDKSGGSGRTVFLRTVQLRMFLRRLCEPYSKDQGQNTVERKFVLCTDFGSRTGVENPGGHFKSRYIRNRISVRPVAGDSDQGFPVCIAGLCS